MFFHPQLDGIDRVALLALTILSCGLADVIVQLKVVVVPLEVGYDLVRADVP